MPRKQVLGVMVFLIYLLVILHGIALFFYLYWTYPWLDLVTHFLGGFWVGLATLWFIYLSEYIVPPDFTWKRALLVALIAALLMGSLWEVYEFLTTSLTGLSFEDNYVKDTLLDICMDLLGACAGFLSFWYLQRKRISIA